MHAHSEICVRTRQWCNNKVRTNEGISWW